MESNILYFGRYEGWLRHLARGVRDNDSECIAKAARLFDLMLPSNCVVVPMPSCGGSATTMLAVAAKIGGEGRKVFNGLVCNPHESSFSQKKSGIFPRFVNMVLDNPQILGENWKARDYYIIDNVVCTGVTAASALDAFRAYGVYGVHVCTLAKSTWR